MNISHSKNILYNSTLIADGNIHIGDKIYHIHQDFEQTILFLTIEKVVLKKEKTLNRTLLELKPNFQYQATLAIKSKHVKGEVLLKEPIQIPLTSRLLETIQQFSAEKRSHTGSDSRFFTQLSPNELWLEESRIAQALFENIITGDIKQVCEDFIGLLNKGKIRELVLTVHSSEPEILNLPFELLQNEFGEYWSLQNDSFCIAHTTEKEIRQFNMQGTIAVAAPLRILFITALPEDLPENGKFLELEKEQQKVIEAIAVLESQRKVVVEFLDIAALENIDKALTKGKHHIVHISGHGAHLEQQKTGILYLEDLDGNTREVSGESLGEVLNRHKSSLKLVMLSACETARAEEGGIIGGLIKTSGIPAIIGMRYPISDAAAILFTTQFYGHLCDNKSLTTALFHAKESVYQKENNQRKNQPNTIHSSEWFTPFLYLNQYVDSFIDTSKAIEIPIHFYKSSSLLKSKYSRTVADGFIGRRSYIAQLNQYFAKGKAVCIYGLGGIGKTTLGERFAENYQNKQYQLIQFNRGVLTEQQIIETIAQEAYFYLKDKESLLKRLKFQISSDKQPLEKLQLLISNYLARPDVKTILFIDNFEDNLIGDPKQNSNATDGTNFHEIKSESLKECLQFLLKELPKDCLFLMTCRYTVEDLRLIDMQLGKMSFPEVYRLFNTSDKLRQISYRERQAIYGYLGGHPRAFELLLKYLENSEVTWEEIEPTLPKVAGELVYHDLFLERLWELFNEEERELMCGISIFNDITPINALITVLQFEKNKTIKILNKVHRLGLIILRKKNNEFLNYKLTSNFILEEKSSEFNQKESHFRAAQFFSNLRHVDGYREISDFLLARDHFLRGGYIEEFIEYSRTAASLFHQYGFNNKAKDILYEAINELDDTIINQDSVTLFSNLAIIEQKLGNQKASLKYFQIALSEVDNIDLNLKVFVLRSVGTFYLNQGKYDEAEKYLFRSLKLAQKANLKIEIGNNLGQLGSLYHRKGNLEQALINHKGVLKIFEEIKDLDGMSKVYQNIGMIYSQQKKLVEAELYFQKSYLIVIAKNDTHSMLNIMYNLGIIRQQQGKIEQAIKTYNTCLEIEQHFQTPSMVAGIHYQLGTIYKAKNNYNIAFKCFEKSLSISEMIDNHHLIGLNWLTIGSISIEGGIIEKALEFSLSAWCIFARYKIKDDENRANGQIAHIKNMLSNEDFLRIQDSIFKKFKIKFK